MTTKPTVRSKIGQVVGGLPPMKIFFVASRRGHTSSLCDWSSDVCSSDLARTTVGEDTARQHEPVLVLRPQVGERLEALLVQKPGPELELGFHVGLIPSRADEAGVALGAEQQADRLREDRLPRAGLAGDRVQPRRRLELGLPDEDEVLDAEPTKQTCPDTFGRRSLQIGR